MNMTNTWWVLLTSISFSLLAIVLSAQKIKQSVYTMDSFYIIDYFSVHCTSFPYEYGKSRSEKWRCSQYR